MNFLVASAASFAVAALFKRLVMAWMIRRSVRWLEHGLVSLVVALLAAAAAVVERSDGGSARTCLTHAGASMLAACAGVYFARILFVNRLLADMVSAHPGGLSREISRALQSQLRIILRMRGYDAAVAAIEQEKNRIIYEATLDRSQKGLLRANSNLTADNQNLQRQLSKRARHLEAVDRVVAEAAGSLAYASLRTFAGRLPREQADVAMLAHLQRLMESAARCVKLDSKGLVLLYPLPRERPLFIAPLMRVPTSEGDSGNGWMCNKPMEFANSILQAAFVIRTRFNIPMDYEYVRDALLIKRRSKGDSKLFPPCWVFPIPLLLQPVHVRGLDWRPYAALVVELPRGQPTLGDETVRALGLVAATIDLMAAVLYDDRTSLAHIEANAPPAPGN